MHEGVPNVGRDGVDHLYRAGGDGGVAVLLVGEQGVMDREPAPVRAVEKPVVVLVALGMSTSLGVADDRPLHADVPGLVHVDRLVDAKGGRDVVEQHL